MLKEDPQDFDQISLGDTKAFHEAREAIRKLKASGCEFSVLPDGTVKVTGEKRFNAAVLAMTEFRGYVKAALLGILPTSEQAHGDRSPTQWIL